MYQRKNEQLSQKAGEEEWVTCPHCGHSTNDPGSTTCESCYESLPIPLTPRQSKLKLVADSQKKKAQKRRNRTYWALAGGVGILASSVFMVSTLNASPEARLRKAEDVIYYDGEPCSRFLMGEEIAQVLKKINKKLILVNDKVGNCRHTLWSGWRGVFY